MDEKTAKTRSVFLWTRLLSTPFYVLFTLLPYILYKEGGASLFQVTTLMILKPSVSLVAPYLSAWIHRHPRWVNQNLMWASVLKFFPFLFIPWIDRVEYFALASLVYLILGRGVIPAWMEILKINIPGGSRTKVFAYGQAFDYLGIALFPVMFGWILDGDPAAWRSLFSWAAFTGIVSSFYMFRIPRQNKVEAAPVQFNPWRQSYALLKSRPDFTRFQVGFMFGGAGLMILQPALTFFFTDTLKLSYQEMAFAIAFCKGIGYAAATPFWAPIFGKMNIFRFCSLVTLLAALFPIVLLLAGYQINFLWLAFLGYGVMQAGSELAWHLSGPVFSMEKDSSLYSQTNILMQGIRGAITPWIGWLICTGAGAPATLFVGSALCLVATLQLSYPRRIEHESSSPSPP